jgi:hypothetical protein
MVAEVATAGTVERIVFAIGPMFAAIASARWRAACNASAVIRARA